MICSIQWAKWSSRAEADKATIKEPKSLLKSQPKRKDAADVSSMFQILSSLSIILTLAFKSTRSLHFFGRLGVLLGDYQEVDVLEESQETYYYLAHEDNTILETSLVP